MSIAGLAVHLSDVMSTRLVTVPEDPEVHGPAGESLPATQGVPATHLQEQPVQEADPTAQVPDGTSQDAGGTMQGASCCTLHLRR